MIKVDFSKVNGPIKPMNAVNNGPIIAGNDQTRGDSIAYEAANIPYARNHDAAFCSTYGGEHAVDVLNIFPNFDADVDDPKSYDFVLTDHYIEQTLSVKTETFYRLGHKIEHNIKKYGTLPPKDFYKWAQICEHIIRHMNEGWANGHHYNIQYWEIWNEPDGQLDNEPNHLTWGGTERQFYDLFEVTAKHLKKCFPNLKIGGPAIAFRMDWSERFLLEMKARQVPMDFFSWHIYTTDPHEMIERGNIVQDLLKKSHYEGIESICNEWNYVKGWTDDFIYSLEQIISLKGAAFVASCMCLSQESPIDMLMYYDARPCAFNGLFNFYSLKTMHPYYPIFYWGQMAKLGMAVHVDTPEGIDGVAAMDANGKAGILLTRYTDDDEEKEVLSFLLEIKGLNAKEAFISRTNQASKYQKEQFDLSQMLTLEPNEVVYLELQ